MSDRPEIQQGIIANDQAQIEIGKVDQTMGDRVEQNHSGSGDNVAGNKYVHVHQPAPPPPPTGDGPPTNLQDRGVARDRFFGRDNVLEELHQLLQKGDHRVAIASVDGMGGVGKSELAVQYARQHLHETYRG
ncbi:hypothetical protein AMR42_00620, partial [Limnothrix sp. PR1529]